MSDATTTKWPGRPDIVPCAIFPGKFFEDPELKTATFARMPLGTPQVWSGSQATVLQATLADGRKTAVRFVHHKDEQASTRYDALDKHLSDYPVRSMVHTRWVNRGLRVDDALYPILKMDWIEGLSLDAYLKGIVGSATAADELRTIADVWRGNCQALMQSGMSHGDVHAGNAMVTSFDGGVGLRLVDYDNVWVPGLRVPCKEEGNAAFQHPQRASLQDGPYLDAFPNTLTYLSLRGLAGDPGLWPNDRAEPDDTLLFLREDLDAGQAPSSKIWNALRNSRDPEVRSLAEIAISWLGDAPDRYRWLEDAIAAAKPQPLVPPQPVRNDNPLNVWPPPANVPHNPGPRRPPRNAQPNPHPWPAQAAPIHPPGQPRHNRPVQPNFGRQQPQGPVEGVPAPNLAPGAHGMPGQQQWKGAAPQGPPVGFTVAGPPPPPQGQPSVPAKRGSGNRAALIIALIVFALFVGWILSELT